MSEKKIEFFYTADFKWPKQLNTSLRDEKIINYLKCSERPDSQQAIKNATRLRDLIPRASSETILYF